MDSPSLLIPKFSFEFLKALYEYKLTKLKLLDDVPIWTSVSSTLKEGEAVYLSYNNLNNVDKELSENTHELSENINKLSENTHELSSENNNKSKQINDTAIFLLNSLTDFSKANRQKYVDLVLGNSKIQYIFIGFFDLKKLSFYFNLILQTQPDYTIIPDAKTNRITHYREVKQLFDIYSLSKNGTELNINLIKWRILPNFAIEKFTLSRVVLIGAGTLGCHILRGLIAYGICNFIIIDCGSVSWSNLSRQSCYNIEHVGMKKVDAIADFIEKNAPHVTISTYSFEVPMCGHSTSWDIENFETLNDIFKNNDYIFTLTDSRESRYVPTLLSIYYQTRISLTTAIGFDSWVVKIIPTRRSDLYSCYFCNDLNAPGDSITSRSIDLQCTVSRPGAAMSASSTSIELFGAILQDEQNFSDVDIPDCIRGYLAKFSSFPVETERNTKCVCCSSLVYSQIEEMGLNAFVQSVVCDPIFLEDLIGDQYQVNEDDIIHF